MVSVIDYDAGNIKSVQKNFWEKKYLSQETRKKF